MKNDCDLNITYSGKKWAKQIKTLLNELCLTYICNHQDDWNININTIKQRLIDTYKQTWYLNINNSSKLSTYSLFKHNFDMEPYLHKIIIEKYKVSLTKFRLSSHDLRIEKGRYDGTNRENRKCLNCNMGVIEKEYHFLLICPKFYNIRQKFIKEYYCRWPTVQKFEKLMSSNNPETLLNLSKYLFNAFRERERAETNN